jgi:hypothetical protein
MKKNKKRWPITPKANAAISSSADTEAVDDDDLDTLGIYRKPH